MPAVTNGGKALRSFGAKSVRGVADAGAALRRVLARLVNGGSQRKDDGRSG